MISRSKNEMQLVEIIRCRMGIMSMQKGAAYSANTCLHEDFKVEVAVYEAINIKFTNVSEQHNIICNTV